AFLARGRRGGRGRAASAPAPLPGRGRLPPAPRQPPDRTRRHVALPARLRGRRALPSRAGRTYQEADGSLPGPSRAEPQGHGARALAPPHPARRLAVLGPGGRASPPSARKAEPAAPGRRRAVAGALLPAALRTPLRSRRTSLPH